MHSFIHKLFRGSLVSPRISETDATFARLAEPRVYSWQLARLSAAQLMLSWRGGYATEYRSVGRRPAGFIPIITRARPGRVATPRLPRPFYKHVGVFSFDHNLKLLPAVRYLHDNPSFARLGKCSCQYSSGFKENVT